MGLPLASLIANILMCQLEKELVPTMRNELEEWTRFVDDTFAFINRYAAQSIKIKQVRPKNPIHLRRRKWWNDTIRWCSHQKDRRQPTKNNGIEKKDKYTVINEEKRRQQQQTRSKAISILDDLHQPPLCKDERWNTHEGIEATNWIKDENVHNITYHISCGSTRRPNKMPNRQMPRSSITAKTTPRMYSLTRLLFQERAKFSK